MDLWDHTATSPLSPCPGWSDAWNQRALAGHTALPAWLDRGLRVSALQVTPPCLPGQLALSLDHLEPTRYRHLGLSPVTRDPIPRCCPAPAYGASHRGGDACQGPRGLLSPHRPHRQPGQPPSAPARTGLRPDGDPRGHGSRLTGRGHLGRLGRQQGWGAGALSPQPAPRPGAAEHVGGASPSQDPHPHRQSPQGAQHRGPARAGVPGVTRTPAGGALWPRTPRRPALLHPGLWMEEPGCAQRRGVGAQSRRHASPPLPTSSGLGPQPALACASHTRGHRRACQRGGATHLLHRSGGAWEHPGHCRGDRRGCQRVLGVAGAQRGLAGSSEGRHLPAWGPALTGNQNVPEEDGVSHAEELLLVGDEGHGLHWLRVANVHLGWQCRPDLRHGPCALSARGTQGRPPPSCPPAWDTHLAAEASLRCVVPQPDSPLGGCEQKAAIRAEGQGGTGRGVATGQLQESALAVRQGGHTPDRRPGEPSPARSHWGAAGSPGPPRRGRREHQGRSREERGQVASHGLGSPAAPRGLTWRPAR